MLTFQKLSHVVISHNEWLKTAATQYHYLFFLWSLALTINQWPKEDRPREKLQQQGESQLTDAELIAILLKTGTRGKSALDIAKHLLTTHGGLRKLMQLPAATLMQTSGIGAAKYAALKAAFILGKRCLSEPPPLYATLANSRATQQFLADKLRDYPVEVFACLFLDTQFRLINFDILFYGTINEANVYPREIVKKALDYHAAHIILAHNHPSGAAQPSHADQEVTSLIVQALALVDIKVADHIIVGHPDIFSFAEAGLLS